MKCSRCGVESDVEQAFVVRKQWAGLVTRSFCPPCWETSFLREQLGSLAVLILLLALLDRVTFQSGLPSVLADIAFLTLANYPLVVGHELFHAAAARLLGVRVYSVVIGYGKAVFSRRRFGINWELRLLPFGGGTVLAGPPQAGSRWRIFGAVLAGPCFHALVLAAALSFQLFLTFLSIGFGFDAPLLEHWTGLFILCNVVLLLFNLMPVKTRMPAGEAGTDGWRLLNQMLMKPEEEKKQEEMYYAAEAMYASQRNDTDAALRAAEEGLSKFPENPVLRNMLGTVLIKKKRYREARDVFLALLSSEEANKLLFRYLLYNNIAYLDALIRDPDLLAEADRYSAESFRQLRWEPSIVGTRGTVLVELGRLDEGIGLLKEALAKHRDPFGRAANAYHLAVAEGRRGNAGESRRYYDLAGRYAPGLFLLEGTAPQQQGM